MTEFEKYVKSYFDTMEMLAHRSKIIRNTDNLLDRNALIEEYYLLWSQFVHDFAKIKHNDTVRAECERRYGKHCVRGPNILCLWNRYYKET